MGGGGGLKNRMCLGQAFSRQPQTNFVCKWFLWQRMPGQEGEAIGVETGMGAGPTQRHAINLAHNVDTARLDPLIPSEKPCQMCLRRVYLGDEKTGHLFPNSQFPWAKNFPKDH